jgi:3'(2'), 5'-bisphosphate nucleotidase
MDLNALLPAVVDIARSAGQKILEIYETEFAIAHKDDRSPLTAADLASHRAITAALQALAPRYPILSEESAAAPQSERRDWNPYWLVDPLDGTKEFISRNGEFTVNIALIHDHRPVLGVVHVPVQRVDYYGAASVGAFKAQAGQRKALHTARLGSGPVRVVGSRSHRGELLDAYLERLGPHEMVPMGSSLKFCIVAEGGADLYPRLGPTSEWDTAAAQAVVECAGGHVVGVDGEPLRYNVRESILNPHFLVYGDASRDWRAPLGSA